ncbi:hypothetical protein EDC01DRAFT_192144 [Geopyxis carbonaria]|nr:hypothetical protein EDC01DRAFT_192144 [Geopyxis carbonaria]
MVWVEGSAPPLAEPVSAPLPSSLKSEGLVLIHHTHSLPPPPYHFISRRFSLNSSRCSPTCCSLKTSPCPAIILPFCHTVHHPPSPPPPPTHTYAHTATVRTDETERRNQRREREIHNPSAAIIQPSVYPSKHVPHRTTTQRDLIKREKPRDRLHCTALLVAVRNCDPDPSIHLSFHRPTPPSTELFYLPVSAELSHPPRLRCCCDPAVIHHPRTFVLPTLPLGKGVK